MKIGNHIVRRLRTRAYAWVTPISCDMVFEHALDRQLCTGSAAGHTAIEDIYWALKDVVAVAGRQLCDYLGEPDASWR